VDSILETGKNGYNCDAEFDARTRAAVTGESSEWGDPAKLFERDAVEVLEFIQGDYQHVAPILAGPLAYRLLDVGCGYGRLAPLLSAFRCVRYVGIDRQSDRLEKAATRWDEDRCLFVFGNALDRKTWNCGRRELFDVVWTSTVLQHLVLSDKKRLVETMKAARAPGGICLLREEEIHPMSLKWCEDRYRSERQPKHMIPVPEDLMREWFAPLEFRRVGGNVWQARETA